MGSVPRLHRLSQNWLKFSGFVELDELIILVINCYDFDYGLGLKLAKYSFHKFLKTMAKVKSSHFCDNIFSFISRSKWNILHIF